MNQELEEALLLAMFLRRERSNWSPKVGVEK
jgi:hypothetical protein